MERTTITTRTFFLLLLLVIQIQTQIPSGFTTFFDTANCPSGWNELSVAKGRLIVSTTSSSDVGITVNNPLEDREDRVHQHYFETDISLTVKSISADGCCNSQGACAGDYKVLGNTTSSTSGLPFVQLILCSLADEAPSSEVPYGTVGYFDPTGTTGSTCPPGWSPLASSSGRVIIPSYQQGGVIESSSSPLTSGEDIKHNHTFTSSFQTTDVSYAGITGCCNDELAESNTYTFNGMTSPSSSNLPYIQLLTCVSINKTFEADFPVGAMLFNEISCPPGWNVSLTVSGRFPVALPVNGLPGATFGGPSLPYQDQQSVSHDHPIAASFSTNDCEVGLASGCCGSGYVGDDTYSFSTTSADNDINIPYLSMPLCVQV